MNVTENLFDLYITKLQDVSKRNYKKSKQTESWTVFLDQKTQHWDVSSSQTDLSIRSNSEVFKFGSPTLGREAKPYEISLTEGKVKSTEQHAEVSQDSVVKGP